jgi:hypothetical protein
MRASLVHTPQRCARAATGQSCLAAPRRVKVPRGPASISAQEPRDTDNDGVGCSGRESEADRLQGSHVAGLLAGTAGAALAAVSEAGCMRTFYARGERGLPPPRGPPAPALVGEV